MANTFNCNFNLNLLSQTYIVYLNEKDPLHFFAEDAGRLKIFVFNEVEKV